jgi:hypothetical protein
MTVLVDFAFFGNVGSATKSALAAGHDYGSVHQRRQIYGMLGSGIGNELPIMYFDIFCEQSKNGNMIIW